MELPWQLIYGLPFGKLTKLKIKITGADTPDKWM